VQDPQVFLGRPPRLPLQERVVGHAEAARREQVRPVAVVGEGTRLADQPVDDVAVLDPVPPTPPQPGQFLEPLLAVPDFDPLGVQPGLDALADQPTGHRVDVPLDSHGAAAVHPHLQPFARLQPMPRQRSQQGPLLGQAADSARVLPGERLLQEGGVAVAAGEVAAAPQHQRLVQGPLEAVMALLHVAVLVALARLDRLPLQTVVTQQRLVALLESLPPSHSRLDGRRQPIRAVQYRHAAEFPQGVLQPLAEALVALREAHRARLPVGVRQNEVVDQVGERTPVDRHPQLRAVGEVASGQPAGVMHLGEEDLPGRPALGPPPLQPPLQGPQLAAGEATGVATPQVVEEGLRLESGLGPERLLQFGPELGEGVGASPPVPVHGFDLAGKHAEPAILAGGLGIHAGPQRRHLFGDAVPVEAAELPHLLAGDHREPPCQGLSMMSIRSRIGNSNCR
jgi:hypothetical protein